MRNAQKERWLSLRVRDTSALTQRRNGNLLCRRRERYWKGSGLGFLKARVSRPANCHVRIGLLPPTDVSNLLFSAKVVIGDLDVAAADAVVATITKNGGCVTLAVQRGNCLTLSKLLTEERPHPPNATSSAGTISFPSSNLRLSAMAPSTLWSVCPRTLASSTSAGRFEHS